MLRNYEELVYQIRGKRKRVEYIENGADCLGNLYGYRNVAISRINPSKQEPDVLICFVSVLKLEPIREPRRAILLDPYSNRKRFAEEKEDAKP